jgi:phage gp36-like protein
MAYAAVQDLIDRFGERELIQLTDRAEPAAGTIDLVVAGKALSDADELINGYVAVVYTLPLSTTPAILTDVACLIARYRLHREPTDKVKYDYEDALKRLERIAKGLVKLPGEAGDAPAPAAGVILTSGNPRDFTRESMEGL